MSKQDQENLDIMDESIWKHGDTFPDVPDDELKKIVLGIIENRIFTDRHIHQNETQSLMGMIFMPLVLGAFPASCPRSYLDSIGLIYEYTREASPRSVNGYPIFFSCRFLNKAQAARVMAAVVREQGRRDDIDV